MAETKRVSDRYKISSPSIVLDGNVQITGSSTSVDVITSIISDTTITLNAGETGAGVSTLGTTASIIVDRGTLPSVSIRWNETTDKWQLTTDGSSYVDIVTGASSAAGVSGSVQYNTAGGLDGEAAFVYDSALNTLNVSNVVIGNNEITTSNTNGNLIIAANGSGTINVLNVSSLSYQGSTPSSTASITKFYAATPGAGASGLYFVNTVSSDEIIAKKKAMMMALIM